MANFIRLGEKVSAELFPTYIKFKRVTTRGVRSVNVPKVVVVHSVQNKNSINTSDVLPDHPQTFVSPLPNWKVVKSSFLEQFYIGYTKFCDGYRVGYVKSITCV